MTVAIASKKLFGAGRAFATANTALPTPIRMGVPQDMSFTAKRDVKSLMGEGQSPDAIASGGLDVSCKVTMGTTNARIFSDLLFGVSRATGQTVEADGELGSVPAISPFAIIVANTSAFVADLGVLDKTTGKRLVQVTGIPTTGQYQLSAGSYVFASADQGHTMAISYSYTVASVGETVLLGNPKMGSVGSFQANLVFPFTDMDGVEEQDLLTLNNCLASDHEWSTKGGDFGKPTLAFAAGCDRSGLLGSMSFAYQQ